MHNGIAKDHTAQLLVGRDAHADIIVGRVRFSPACRGGGGRARSSAQKDEPPCVGERGGGHFPDDAGNGGPGGGGSGGWFGAGFEGWEEVEGWLFGRW